MCISGCCSQQEARLSGASELFGESWEVCFGSVNISIFWKRALRQACLFLHEFWPVWYQQLEIQLLVSLWYDLHPSHATLCFLEKRRLGETVTTRSVRGLSRRNLLKFISCCLGYHRAFALLKNNATCSQLKTFLKMKYQKIKKNLELKKETWGEVSVRSWIASSARIYSYHGGHIIMSIKVKSQCICVKEGYKFSLCSVGKSFSEAFIAEL